MNDKVAISNNAFRFDFWRKFKKIEYRSNLVGSMSMCWSSQTVWIIGYDSLLLCTQLPQHHLREIININGFWYVYRMKRYGHTRMLWEANVFVFTYECNGNCQIDDSSIDSPKKKKNAKMNEFVWTLIICVSLIIPLMNNA